MECMCNKVILCILDGVGIREEKDGNAFLNANKPNLDMLMNKYSCNLLNASESFVGLPKGQMGTSEVGHMNLGSGRVVLQPIEAINNSILDKSLDNSDELQEIFKHVKIENSNLHIMGLLSDGGVHSHINHLLYLLELCKKNEVKNVYLDIFLDGRDTYEKSALKYLDMLQNKINELGIGKISTISGRYYAMDRDNNYDRIKKSFDAICHLNAPKYNNYREMINLSYENNINDEFIIPGVIDGSSLKENDAVITFNFRKDRLRELFTLFTNKDLSKELSHKYNLKLKDFSNLKVLTMFPVVTDVKAPHIFNDMNLDNLLVDYLHKNNKTQLRIAETEKYAHVTFFFDGGREVEYDTMKKIIIPSPKVATYDLKPEMSAYEVTNKLLEEFENFDVTILNLANGDMVGHTGIYDAAVKAVEVLDECVGKIYKKAVEELHYNLIIIADHGNCDMMWDANKRPITSHTLSKVPFILTNNNYIKKDGKLADIAPTILTLLNLDIPKEMTGVSLIEKIKIDE